MPPPNVPLIECRKLQNIPQGHAEAATLKVGNRELRHAVMSINETKDSINETLESISQVLNTIQDVQSEQRQKLVGKIKSLQAAKADQQEVIRRQESEITKYCTDATAAQERLREISSHLEVTADAVLACVVERSTSLANNPELYDDKVRCTQSLLTSDNSCCK